MGDQEKGGHRKKGDIHRKKGDIALLRLIKRGT
jgi:hypothetical protein